MKMALDTNRYSDLIRGVPDVVEKVRATTLVCVPIIVIGELRAGFSSGTRAASNERILNEFLSRPSVSVPMLDEHTTSVYATLFLHLRRMGKMIPTNDLWIAALCHQHSLPLYSRDAHFDLLPMIARI